MPIYWTGLLLKWMKRVQYYSRFNIHLLTKRHERAAQCRKMTWSTKVSRFYVFYSTLWLLYILLLCSHRHVFFDRDHWSTWQTSLFLNFSSCSPHHFSFSSPCLFIHFSNSFIYSPTTSQCNTTTTLKKIPVALWGIFVFCCVLWI